MDMQTRERQKMTTTTIITTIRDAFAAAFIPAKDDGTYRISDATRDAIRINIAAAAARREARITA